MPIPLFMLVIAGALGVSATFALIFWVQILGWAEDSLFPWIKNNIPSIESAVRKAFSALDNQAVAIRKIIRKAWKKLRKFLLKQVVKLERKSSNKWIRRVTSWVIKVLESGEKVPVKVETEEKVNWDELPEDVRKEFLSKGKSESEIDVTKNRDDEMDMSA